MPALMPFFPAEFFWPFGSPMKSVQNSPPTFFSTSLTPLLLAPFPFVKNFTALQRQPAPTWFDHSSPTHSFPFPRLDTSVARIG